jgi:transcriptional regulator with XRE-family HTH domain
MPDPCRIACRRLFDAFLSCPVDVLGRYDWRWRLAMIGDRVRMLREQRCWTQAHLAEASGVSLRTIQRLERLHSCSGETLMALAAALGVDVRELAEETPRERRRAARPLWMWLTPTRAAAWGAWLALPAVLFVAVNLLKFGAGIAAPYDWLAEAGGQLRLVGVFNLLSPVLFIGGALAAVALSLVTQVRARVEIDEGARILSAVGVQIHFWSAAVMLIALAALIMLMAYAVGENLPDLLRWTAR